MALFSARLAWLEVSVGCGLRIAGSGTKAEIGICGRVTLLACTERVFGAASNGCPDTLVAGSKDLNWAVPPGSAKRTRGHCKFAMSGNEAGARY